MAGAAPARGATRRLPARPVRAAGDGSGSERPRITIRPSDLLEGRAYIRIPFVGKLLLLHWAGAPWLDRKPDAFLHGLQGEVMARGEREKIVHGASRLGKSVLGGSECFLDWLIPGTKTAIVASRYSHVEHEFQYFYKAVRTLFRGHDQAHAHLMYRNRQNYAVFEADSVWGSSVRGYSTDADEGANLLGREFTRVVLGEGSHISQFVLEKRVWRALDSALMGLQKSRRRQGWLSIYTTPKEYEGASSAEFDRIQKAAREAGYDGDDWSVFELDKAPTWAETVWIYEADILENPAYDKKAYEAARTRLSAAAFAEQYQGKRRYRTGRVYPGFDPQTDTVPFPHNVADMRLFVGIDTGAYFGAVLLGLDRNRVLWVLGEVYTEQTKLVDNAEYIKAMLQERLGIPAWGGVLQRIDRWVVDPASQHKLDLIEALDLPTITTPTRGQGQFDLIPTIDTVNMLFDEGQIRVVSDVPIFIDQATRYVWKETKVHGDKGQKIIKEPRKVYDHLMDAFRFAAVPLWEEGPLEADPEPATWAEEWEREQRESLWGDLKRQMREAQEREGW